MAIGERFPRVLLAAGQGAEWAWSELYRDLAPGVLRFLKSQGTPDPEDCLGDSFLEVVRNLHRFEGEEGAFRAWVFTIARGRLVDAWRRAGRRPKTSGEDPTTAADRKHHCGGADGALVQNRSVAAILQSLTPDQRSVLLLRVVHQFSIQETAAIMGKGPGAVKLLHHRAIRTLRRTLMAAHEQDEPTAPRAARLDQALDRTDLSHANAIKAMIART
ncbi:MAG: RNA polymerase sigma factor [Propionicimonas sp.]